MTTDCMIEMEVPELIDEKFWNEMDEVAKIYGLEYDVKTINLNK